MAKKQFKRTLPYSILICDRKLRIEGYLYYYNFALRPEICRYRTKHDHNSWRQVTPPSENLYRKGKELIPFKSVTKIGTQTTVLGNGSKRYNVKIYMEGERVIELNRLYDEDDPKGFDPAISLLQKRTLLKVVKEKDIDNEEK